MTKQGLSARIQTALFVFCLPDRLFVFVVAARASSVQEAVPASSPHAKSPQDCRPERLVLTRSLWSSLLVPFLPHFLDALFFLSPFVTPPSLELYNLPLS